MPARYWVYFVAMITLPDVVIIIEILNGKLSSLFILMVAIQLILFTGIVLALKRIKKRV